MSLILAVESILRSLEGVVPLEVFVFIGSLTEEIVSPIPSTIIMGTAGSIAGAAGSSVLYLLVLSGIGNLGKLIGAFAYYIIGDRLEDVVVKRFGRFFGVTHAQVENLGARFSGHWKDGITLFFLRLTPFAPTTPISIVCGAIRMDKRTFAFASFFGNFVKDFGYLLVGYIGIGVVREFARDMLAIKQYVDIAVAASFLLFLWALWYHRKKGVWLWQQVRGRLERWK